MLIDRITAKQIRDIVHGKLLDFRNTERVIFSDLFKQAWKCASREQRKRILYLLKKFKTNELKEVLKDIIFTGFNTLNIHQLRWLASYLKVKNYSRMSKEELREKLEEKNDKCVAELKKSLEQYALYTDYSRRTKKSNKYKR